MVVLLKVAAELRNALAQHGHLDLRRSGIGGMGLVGVDQLLLFGGIERHARRLALLQECSVEELVDAIVDADLSLLCQAQGVGRRTAERITVELRSSLESQRASFQESDSLKEQQPKEESAISDIVPGDLVNTLDVLGYESSEIRAAIRTVKQTLPPGSGEEVWLRACLKQLSLQ